MRLATPNRILLAVVASFLVLGVCGLVALRLLLSRTREFRAQAERGQPIVRAIEDFRTQAGSYPTSLANLAPKYLPGVPETPNESQNKFSGWDYRIVTNGMTVTYKLTYYMGRGGIEYEPPVWFGNNEGHRTVLLRND